MDTLWDVVGERGEGAAACFWECFLLSVLH